MALGFYASYAATPHLSTLSLLDALPISHDRGARRQDHLRLPQRDHLRRLVPSLRARLLDRLGRRSEEHTSELQSRGPLVCRLLLENKKLEEAHSEDR